MRKIATLILIVLTTLLIAFAVTSCDKEAAEQRIFNDPVMKKALLEKMMADEEMVNTMLNHVLNQPVLVDTIMTRIVNNESMRAKMLTKAFADSAALEDVIFRVQGDPELKKRITGRRR